MADRRSDDQERKPKKRRRAEPQKQAQKEPELQAKNPDQERMGNMALLATATADKILADPPPSPSGSERISELLYGGDAPPDDGPSPRREPERRHWSPPAPPRPVNPAPEDIETFGDPITEPRLPEPDDTLVADLPLANDGGTSVYAMLQPPEPSKGSRQAWVLACADWLEVNGGLPPLMRAALPPASCWSTPDGRLLPAVVAACALVTEAMVQRLGPRPELVPRIAAGLAIRCSIADFPHTPYAAEPEPHDPDPWIFDAVLHRLGLAPLAVPDYPEDTEHAADAEDDPLGLDAVLNGFLPRVQPSRDPQREFYADHSARVAQWLVLLEQGSDAVMTAALRHCPGDAVEGAHARMLDSTEAIARILHEIAHAADGDVVPTRGLQRGFEHVTPALNDARLQFAAGVASAARQLPGSVLRAPLAAPPEAPGDAALGQALEAAALGQPPDAVLEALGRHDSPTALRLRAALGEPDVEALWALFDTELSRHNGVGAAHSALLALDAQVRSGQEHRAALREALEALASAGAGAAVDLLSRYRPVGDGPVQAG